MSDDIDLTDSNDVDEDKKGAAEKDKAKPKRPGGRPTRPASEADLRKRIEEGIGEVVAFLEEREQQQTEEEAIGLRGIVRRDAPRMAEVLAARAVRHAWIAQAVTRLFGKDSELAILRAFGPMVREIMAGLREWRDAQAEVGTEVHVGPGVDVVPPA